MKNEIEKERERESTYVQFAKYVCVLNKVDLGFFPKNNEQAHINTIKMFFQVKA